MNRGLIHKSILEVSGITSLLGAVLFIIEAILAYALPSFQKQFSDQMTQLPFIQTIVKAMVGADVGDGLGPQLFQSIPWSHPVVMAILFAHALICCTRVPAGEVDRGTIDLLLGLPVSRRQVFISETVVWLASGAVLLLLGIAGNALGSALVAPELRPDPSRTLIVVVNLFCLYTAVGAAAWLFSSLSSRRGPAITITLLIVLASFLLNYLAQFWKPAEQTAFLSLLHYHRPVQALQSGHWPWRDLCVLTGVAITLWAAAGTIFSRRDLTTV